MSDPRSTPSRQTMKKAAQVDVSFVDLYRSPGGSRDRQLLLGTPVTVLDEVDDWSYLQSDDGYCGYVQSAALGPMQAATHVINVRSSHSYAQPSMKSPDLTALSHGSLLRVTEFADGFAHTPQGFVPAQHLRPIGDIEDDPITVAERFLGTPYLWGGNSAWGIDCSGLVQAACRACGIPCPGDSDQQEQSLARLLPAGTAPERGDLLFWKGHVAWVWDAQTLLHANAHAMATVYEPLDAAIERIAKTDGPVTAHKRIS